MDYHDVSKEDAVKHFKIRIGEPVVPEAFFEYDEPNDLMVGKSFDCRLCCAAIIDTLKELKGKKLSVDVIGAVA